MQTAFEAKLHMPPGAVPPDVLEVSCPLIPNDEFIVSRDRQGEPKSTFSDVSWDFSAYHPEGKVELIYFDFWGKDVPTPGQVILSAEMRYLVFCLIWRRNGSPFSTGTLRNIVCVLSCLANYADLNRLTIGNIIANHEKLKTFIIHNCSGWMTETLCTLLLIFCKIGTKILGFEIVSDEIINQIKKYNRNYRKIIKQHPPMPTRIYSIFIQGLIDELDKWRLVSKDILSAAVYCAQDVRAGRSRRLQIALSNSLNIEHVDFKVLPDLLSKNSKKYITEKYGEVRLGNISNVIGQAQYTAKLLIQVFSGMRDDEVNTLPYNCRKISKDVVANHYLILGRTTKFSHGLACRANWITNRDGHEAIRTACEIADSIYGLFKVKPEHNVSRINKHPLFPSLRYFGIKTGKILPDNDNFLITTMDHRNLPPACMSVIEEEDLIELENVDPHRSWRSEEKFKLGATWSFTSHQCRRSLALYAHRSGLVSLPSLRRQLKHITDEMSRYYAKGSAFSKNFIGSEKSHFGVDWQNTQSESCGLSYVMNVLRKYEDLSGGHVSWIKQRINKPEGQLFLDRDTTIQKFKKGQLFYKETILGGCTNSGHCDQVAAKWLPIACIKDNCKNLVATPEKLELLIRAQENMISKIDYDSVEYRTEVESLESLKEGYKKIQNMGK